MADIIQVTVARRGGLQGDLLVVGCLADTTPDLEMLPETIARSIRKAVGEFSAEGDRRRFVSGGASAPGNLLLHGLGKAAAWEWADCERWLARVIAEARRFEVKRLLLMPPVHPMLAGEVGGERLARRLALTTYEYREFRNGDGLPRVEDAVLVPPAREAAAWRRGARRGQVVAQAVAAARDLANAPPNLATPEWLAGRARELATRQGMKCRVLGPAQIERQGMGGLLAVGGGSKNPPRLVRMEWGEEGPVIALVGKGVTFDTGGISIKPSAKMEEMKWDKCGACTVVGIVQAVAELALPVRLRAYLPLAENMPDGASYRPGDILRLRNRKTVEIGNTDAEGRLILADALAWAASESPDTLLEYSTLTGAAVVALGPTGAALYTPDDQLAGGLLGAAEAAGERLWRMPLWREFRDEMKGEHADLKNSGGRWGGANTAAAFLSHFVEGVERWAHWDIAGPAYVGGNGKGPRGATGYGIAATIEWLRRQAESS